MCARGLLLKSLTSLPYCSIKWEADYREFDGSAPSVFAPTPGCLLDKLHPAQLMQCATSDVSAPSVFAPTPQVGNEVRPSITAAVLAFLKITLTDSWASLRAFSVTGAYSAGLQWLPS